MKRIYLFILLMGCMHYNYGQASDSVKFEKGVFLEAGIYTHVNQIIGNAPKYFGYRLDPNESHFFKKGDELSCFDRNGNQLKIEDTVIAYVEKGTFFVRYKHWIYPLMSKGAISTFIVSQSTRNTGNASTVDEDIYLYYFDLKTGVINRIKKTQMDKIGELFIADNELYKEFSNLSKSKKKKLYYSYILKYNQRNPIYIKKAF